MAADAEGGLDNNLKGIENGKESQHPLRLVNPRNVPRLMIRSPCAMFCHVIAQQSVTLAISDFFCPTAIVTGTAKFERSFFLDATSSRRNQAETVWKRLKSRVPRLLRFGI